MLGQINDSIKLGKLIDKGFYKTDSCSNCINYKIYKIQSSDLFYEKTYYNDSLLISEGVLKRRLKSIKILFGVFQSSMFYYLNSGPWFEYDYTKNQILVYDWVQGLSKRDSWDVKVGIGVRDLNDKKE